MILCSIQPNQTNAAIKQTGEFTVSVLGTDVHPFVIGNFSFQSGRNADKWENVPYKLVAGLPVLETAVAYLRCKVTDSKELSTHTAFFCEVIDAWLGDGEPLIYGDMSTTEKPHLRTCLMIGNAQYAVIRKAFLSKNETWRVGCTVGSVIHTNTERL